MVDFKKAPDRATVDRATEEGMSEAMGVRILDSETVVYVFANFWPLILGGIILFLMIVRGFERSAMVVGAVVVLIQAALMGAFANFF